MSEADSVIPPDGDLTGIRLGDLQVLQRLGRGGMADVYQATQLSLGRTVAVKVLRPGLNEEPGFGGYVERFQIEARAAARLNHPNIVQVYEVGQRNGLHYISQEFIDGVNLRQAIDRDGPLAIQQAIDVLHAVLKALDQAASAGITHRDIKPENIMLSRRGEVKVADFGLARVAQTDVASNLTQIGLTVGTPLYMSPEQVQGGKVDPRSDLYSLGVTMFHVLTGRPPFDGESSLAIAVKQLHERMPSIAQWRADRTGKNDLPRWLIDIITRLMAKRPEDRYQTAAEVLEIIHRNTGTQPSTPGAAYDSTPANRLQSLMRRERHLRRRWPKVLLLLAVCGGAGAWLASLRARPDLTRNLRSESAPIQQEQTVSEQYVVAMLRDTAEGWESVWKYHPSDNPDSREKQYEIKARLQLGRMYYSQGKNQNVISAVRSVAESPSVRPVYRTLAYLWLSLAYRPTNRETGAQHFEDAKRQASQLDASDRQLLNMLKNDRNPNELQELLAQVMQSVDN